MTAALQSSGHEVHEFSEWSAVATIGGAQLDLVLFDDGVATDLPSQIDVPAIHVTEHHVATPPSSHGVIPSAVFEQVVDALIAIAVELRIHATRCHELARIAEGVNSGSALVGRSPIMRRLQGILSRAADSDATVLIEGPAGSGKSLASRVLHCKSRRSAKSLLAVAGHDLDGEAMTAAIDKARHTTLVIENIDMLPPAAQSVLVKHLKERSGPRADAGPRLVATTSAHLPELIAKGAFREDLYYRLHAFPMVMPALRERVEDITPIAETVLAAGAAHSGRTEGGFTAAALMLLESMPWPGNVAQLEIVVKRAQALAGGAPIDRDHLVAPATSSGVTTVHATARANVAAEKEDEIAEDAIRPFEQEEQLLLSRALRATKGNVRRAAQLLGIGRATLYRKIQQYKLRLQ